MTALTKNRVEVLLPYNTPSPVFDEVTSKMFHLAALPWRAPKQKTPHIKVPHHFTGSGSIALATKMNLNVTMMVNEDTSTPSVRTLIECTNMFVDPANPFAFVDVQTTASASIAGQVRDFFKTSEAQFAALIWPYQTFNVDLLNKQVNVNGLTGTERLQQFFSGVGDYRFIYTHHLLDIDESMVPEAVAVCANDSELRKTDEEITCVTACSVGTVDDLLKGSFKRLISMALIERDAFAAYSGDSIADFLSGYLPKKSGALLPPHVGQFMTSQPFQLLLELEALP